MRKIGVDSDIIQKASKFGATQVQKYVGLTKSDASSLTHPLLLRAARLQLLTMAIFRSNASKSVEVLDVKFLHTITSQFHPGI